MPSDPGRSRAGNAMARTRLAVLAGARECLIRRGSRATTMVDIAQTAGVAKATLYNHFRTKGDVFAALAEAEVTSLVQEAAALVPSLGLDAALCALGQRLAEHPVARGLAVREPAVLGLIVQPAAEGGAAASWATARRELGELLAGHAEGVDLALRFLLTQLLWPGTAPEIAVAVRAICSLRPPVLAVVAAVPDPVSRPTAEVVGV